MAKEKNVREENEKKGNPTSDKSIDSPQTCFRPGGDWVTRLNTGNGIQRGSNSHAIIF